MAWCHCPSGSAETKSSAIRQALQLKMINQYRSVTTAFRKADKDASGKLEVGNDMCRVRISSLHVTKRNGTTADSQTGAFVRRQ